MAAEERDLSTADLAGRRAGGDEERDDERDREIVAESATASPTEDASKPTLDAGKDERAVPLLSHEAVSSAEGRWTTIQTSFVDEPQKAVRDADALVAEVMQELARSFAEERDALESQWKEGRDVSTEDLRQALQRYRSFFQRLLAA